ncbi:hypothetical protein BDN70DRAFT_875705 [Pholiota conissans]|uniref:Uncharacterized protein n=1 Tax=Pholiota conissans TaxID=109636 RepID=A0A9P5Z6V3_9AGAR|nr:hypothetical protein BDN70DRAFT_875705 [Pholiota conissans]
MIKLSIQIQQQGLTHPIRSIHLTNLKTLHYSPLHYPQHQVCIAFAYMIIYLPENYIIPVEWSCLTHLLLDNFLLSFPFWFQLIRSLPALELVALNIERLLHINLHAEPAQHTLHLLSEAYVHVYDDFYHSHTPPLSLMFRNLHLPTLKTLSLASYDDSSWNDPIRGIDELYAVLKSTPALTTLTLNDGCTGFTDSRRRCHPPPSNAPPPIWSLLPKLAYVQFELDDTSPTIPTVRSRKSL